MTIIKADINMKEYDQRLEKKLLVFFRLVSSYPDIGIDFLPIA